MPARMFYRFATRLAALFVLTCTAALAQTTIHVPADQPTIQAGINAAKNGDTVLVAPDTYYENIDFKGKAITVTSSAGAAKTIIDGGGVSPAVTFKTSEPRTAVLSNLTIQHGGDTKSSSFTPTGGVYISNSSPTILNNTITLNNCWDILIYGAAPLIQGNEISATQSPQYGCGFGSGAAIYVGGNLMGSYPAAGDGTPAVITGNTIENNVLSGLSDAGGNGGAGVAVWGGSPTIESNIFRNNFTYGSGGAINVVYGSGASIAQNLIYGNQAACGAGAIAFQGGGVAPGFYILIANNTMVDNVDKGHEGYSECIDISQIYPSPDSYGYSGPSAVIVNNIISGSTTYAAVNCSWFDTPSEAIQPIFDHNIVYNAGSAFFGSYCVDVSAKYGNISADPQFLNVATGDYHVKATSPAIDSGNSSALQSLQSLTGTLLATDLDNKPRLQDATAKGYPIIDIGAYEYSGVLDARATTVVLTSSAYTGNAGSNYTLTATFASPIGVPTGSAAFFLDGKLIGTTLINGAGIATLTNFLLVPGVHSLYASYGGQGSFTPATSVIIIVNINLYSTTLTLASSPNPSLVGQPVTFKLTAASADNGYIPSPITLKEGSTTLATLTPDSSGIATYTTSTLALGYHFITATYAGDASHSSAQANVDQQVTSGYPTSITLTSSSNPSIFGQNVTFTSTITSTNGTPTGGVQFTDNGTSIGTQTLNASGVATFSTSTLPVGTHNITATYIPTGSFAGSSTSIEQTVSAITNTVNLTSSLNPSRYGQPVTITAHVVPNNGVMVVGSVTFYEGVQYLGMQPVNASGNASITLSDLQVGGHIITGAFSPTNGPVSASGSLTQFVNSLPSATVLSVSPLTGVAHITPITLTATVTPASSGGATPTGQVLFYVNTAQFNLATLVNGVATYTGTLPAGVDQIYALFLGDAGRVYDGSTSNTVSVTITAAPSTLSLTSSLNPAPAMTPFTLTAHLGIPNGPQPGAGYLITLTPTALAPGGGPLTPITLPTNSSGTVAYNYPGLLPGQYSFTATFAGTTDLQPSSPITLIETITANATATTLTASPNPGIQNNPVTFTSTVSALAGAATPSGTVIIYDGLSPNPPLNPIATLTLPAGGSTVTFTTSTLAPGPHILYAAYTPTTAFVPSQSAQLALTIQPQSFTLTLSDSTLTLQTGHQRTLTASLTSIGGLTGAFNLSCDTLPQFASCIWNQTSITLPANGTVSTSLTIDTDQLIGFLASNSRPASDNAAGPLMTRSLPIRHDSPGGPFMTRSLWHEWGTTAALTLFPLTLLGFRRRRNLQTLFPLLLLAALASTLTACGANQYPYSTAPGTYTIHITAAGPPTPGGASPTQTVNLTLVVTR